MAKGESQPDLGDAPKAVIARLPSPALEEAIANAARLIGIKFNISRG